MNSRLQWRPVPSIPELIRRASETTGIPVPEIIGPTRGPHRSPLAKTRWAIMKVAREKYEYPWRRIGARLGGRNHATIIYGVKRAAELAERDEKFRALVSEIAGAQPFSTKSSENGGNPGRKQSTPVDIGDKPGFSVVPEPMAGA